jgi:transcriptional regulator with GAF, ATPase, and Fis domain
MARPSDAAPCLFLVFDCDRPVSAPARFSLRGIGETSLGRGERRSAVISGESASRRLAIEVPDRWMSSRHARLLRVLGGSILEDEGSKNGTLVNGRTVRSAMLADGDLIELGHTFLLFRESVPIPPGEAISFEAGSPRASQNNLDTLVSSLAEQFRRLEKIAPSAVPVLLGGETGTGKEIVASAVHALSGRPGPFQAVNCGALPATLIESELFGYRKGAFSGADEDRPGLVRSADGGTLFLDEIADLPPPAQAALLRVLEQQSEVLAVGATRPVKVNIRLISATHRPLAALVAQERFREDLLSRISGFALMLPPLRERREDLGLLTAVLLQRVAPEQAERISFSCEAGRALLLHRWPGNVRELQKCLSVAVVLAGDGPIELTHLPDAVQGPHPAPHSAVAPPAGASPARAQPPLSEDTARRQPIEELLDQHRGNVAAVARSLGKGRFQVQRWIKRYGIETDRFRH